MSDQKPRLPMGLRAVAGLGLAAGILTGLYVFLVLATSVLGGWNKDNGYGLLLGTVCVFTFLLWFLSSIGILLRRDWGRKGTIAALAILAVYVILALIADIFAHPTPGLLNHFGKGLGLIALVFVIAIGYLLSREARKALK